MPAQMAPSQSAGGVEIGEVVSPVVRGVKRGASVAWDDVAPAAGEMRIVTGCVRRASLLTRDVAVMDTLGGSWCELRD